MAVYNVNYKTIVLGLVVVGLAMVAGEDSDFLSYGAYHEKLSDHSASEKGTTTVPTPPWGPSSVGQFKFAAVATDTDICSKVGRFVLAGMRGSSVDAAVAAMFCVGVVNIHSTGIGGGHFMTVYDTPREESEKIITTFLSREVAPGAATGDMFVNNPGASTLGGLAVGVPGEVAGLYTAWKKFGRVDWRRLVKPSIFLCLRGMRVNEPLASAISASSDSIREDPNLAELLVKSDGSLATEGDVIKLPKLANTLKQIADDPMSFYSGSLAKDIVADLQEYESIITEEDLSNYMTREKEPVQVTLQNGNYNVFSPPPPSSGAVLQFILKVLDGFELEPASAEPQNMGLTYQRVVETFKFAFAQRSALGDEDFVDVAEIVANLTSPDFAEAVRLRINDTHTQDLSFYDPKFEIVMDQGTAHMSIVAPDGSAVSMTSTINLFFGAKIRGRRTGIIFNNEMDDFSTPGTVNSFGVPASPTNFIEPGKMPMSSMSPTLILDQQGNVILVAGASGGTRIITSTALVMINSLWLGKNVQAAVDTARVHHQLLPNVITAEPHIDLNLVDTLQSFGHETSVEDRFIGVVQLVRNVCTHKKCRGFYCSRFRCIHAVSDGRKGGVPAGF